jgi:hypothetical protein
MNMKTAVETLSKLKATAGLKVKPVFLLIGMVGIIAGVGLILPALANYGRPGPMVADAFRFLLLGVLAVMAGGVSIIHGARKRRI